ncbi:MAG TPA: GFA family protein [Rhizomicrobium sp.]
MTGLIEGGCRCGRIRYTVTSDKLPNVYACHCLDCQTWSGSAFSLQAPLAEAQLNVTGEPSLFERTSPESGRTTYQRGCPVCFTRIYNTNSARPGTAMLRAGTLDRSNELNIVAHIWAKRKMSGVAIPEGVPTWPETPPPADFASALLRQSKTVAN